MLSRDVSPCIAFAREDPSYARGCRIRSG
jgi:hypothetical protein